MYGNTEVVMREYVGLAGWAVGLPLDDDNRYECDRIAQHNSSHNEQNDPELGNRKNPAIECKTRHGTASAHRT